MTFGFRFFCCGGGAHNGGQLQLEFLNSDQKRPLPSRPIRWFFSGGHVPPGQAGGVPDRGTGCGARCFERRGAAGHAADRPPAGPPGPAGRCALSSSGLGAPPSLRRQYGKCHRAVQAPGIRQCEAGVWGYDTPIGCVDDMLSPHAQGECVCFPPWHITLFFWIQRWVCLMLQFKLQPLCPRFFFLAKKVFSRRRGMRPRIFSPSLFVLIIRPPSPFITFVALLLPIFILVQNRA